MQLPLLYELLKLSVNNLIVGMQVWTYLKKHHHHHGVSLAYELTLGVMYDYIHMSSYCLNPVLIIFIFIRQLEQEMETIVKLLQPEPLGTTHHTFTSK